MLIDLYKKCKSEERDWINELEQTEDSRLRSDRLYLYYTQNGRCMYSGDPIELKDLWDNTKYDIDHIYPQSKVMDDSLDMYFSAITGNSLSISAFLSGESSRT